MAVRGSAMAVVTTLSDSDAKSKPNGISVRILKYFANMVRVKNSWDYSQKKYLANTCVNCDKHLFQCPSPNPSNATEQPMGMYSISSICQESSSTFPVNEGPR